MPPPRSPGPVSELAGLRRRRGDPRSLERLRAHYDLEVRLARRLMNAPKAERPRTYKRVYDELLAGIPDHPQHARRQSADGGHVDAQLRRLRRHLGKDKVFLEIGSGDCRLAFAVCRLVRHVIAVDVSDQLVNLVHAPGNFSFVTSDGASMPISSGSVDVAYSNQLLEHLHPDDVVEHLENVYDGLKPAGVYCCVTPSRISGPHDISVYFDTVARGFHLKEYTYRELTDLLGRAGFREVRYGLGGLEWATPGALLFALEAALDNVPDFWRPALCQNAIASRLLGIHAIAYK